MLDEGLAQIVDVKRVPKGDRLGDTRHEPIIAAGLPPSRFAQPRSHP
jgi:hypothetical protein